MSKTKPSKLKSTYLLVLVAVGLSISLIAFLFFVNASLESSEKKFQAAAIQSFSRIENRFELLAQIDEDLAQFFYASDDVTSVEFGDFTQPILARNSFLKQMMLASVVPKSERKIYEAAKREEGFTGFVIKEHSDNANESNFYYPVEYYEPVSIQASLWLGQDLRSIAETREAFIQIHRDSFYALSKPFEVNSDLSFLILHALSPVGYLSLGKKVSEEDAYGVLAYIVNIKDLLNLHSEGLEEANYYVEMEGQEIFMSSESKDEFFSFNRIFISEKDFVFSNSSIHFKISRQARISDIEFLLPSLIFLTGMMMTGFVFSTSRSELMRSEILEQQKTEISRQVKNQTRQLRHQAASLAMTRDHALKASQTKSTFLANMSHELRTPLNSIIGFSEIMGRGMSGPVVDEQKKQLDIILVNARGLLALINNVLDLSKVESGKVDIDISSVDVAALLKEVEATFIPLAKDKNLALEVIVSQPNESINTDHEKLRQILMNLIANAIKFTNQGSIKIEYFSHLEYFCFRIVDTGIGISSEKLRNIFDDFYQVEGTAARNYEGTGLGLAISQRFAELLGGFINVESSEESGSVFSLYISDMRLMEEKRRVIQEFSETS